MIELVTGREVVRKRPAFFLGPLDPYATHRLIRCAIDGLLWHYQRLDQALDRIAVGLADDGSATVTSHSRGTALVRGHEGRQLFQRELQELSVGVQGLFILNALSARLDAAARTADDLWHHFTFDQGLLRHEEVRVQATAASADIRLAFWPDHNILERGIFDLTRTLDQVRPFADSNPEVAIDVTGGHLDAQDV